MELEVGEAFEVVGGGTPSRGSPRFWDGDIPWVTSADLEEDLGIRIRRSVTTLGIEKSAASVVPAGSVIVATRVGLGKIGLAVQPMSFSQDCQALIPPTGIDAAFAAHQLKWLSRRFAGQARGTTISGITKKQLLSTAFSIAPLPEQRRIVAKIEELFSELDAGVAALERAQAKLERYRASVLKASVEGRLTEQWRKENPPEETGEELLKRILAERRKRWGEEQLAGFEAKGKTPPKGWREKHREPEGPDTSELPELPEGWCWVGLAQVASFQNGRAFPSNEYSASGVRLLRPGNLMADGRVVWREDNTRFMPTTWLERFPAYLVRGGELVMNLTAQSLKDEFLGRTSLTDEGEACLLNQRLARLTPLRLALPSFLLAVLKAERFRRFVDGLNKGSLIQHMFTRQLSQFFFPFPPIQEQEVIAKTAAEATENVSRTQCTVSAQIRRVELMRSAILKLAFEGRLVPQDPNDEPASVLLERIRASRKAEKPAAKRPRKRKSSQGSLDL